MLAITENTPALHWLKKSAGQLMGEMLKKPETTLEMITGRA